MNTAQYVNIIGDLVAACEAVVDRLTEPETFHPGKKAWERCSLVADRDLVMQLCEAITAAKASEWPSHLGMQRCTIKGLRSDMLKEQVVLSLGLRLTPEMLLAKRKLQQYFDEGTMVKINLSEQFPQLSLLQKPDVSVDENTTATLQAEGHEPVDFDKLYKVKMAQYAREEAEELPADAHVRVTGLGE